VKKKRRMAKKILASTNSTPVDEPVKGGQGPKKVSPKRSGQAPKGVSKSKPVAGPSSSKKAASYSLVAKKEFEVIVKAANDEVITDSQGELIQNSLFQLLAGEKGALPSFNGVKLKKGRLHFLSNDLASMTWLMGAVSKCIPWKEAKLLAIKASDQPKMALAKIWIPGCFVPEKEVVDVLGRQNGLNTSKWEIQSYKSLPGSEKSGKGSLLYAYIDPESEKIIEDRNAKLFFKFGLVNVKLTKAKPEAKGQN
jgi:Domain of unknown function (DUF4780)